MNNDGDNDDDNKDNDNDADDDDDDRGRRWLRNYEIEANIEERLSDSWVRISLYFFVR